MRFQIVITIFVAFLLLLPMRLFSQTETDSATAKTQVTLACDDSTWATIKKTKNISLYNDFLTACPDSRWSVLAKHLMKSLELDEAQKNQKRVSLSTKHDVDW
jgi:hypothetical protein